MDKKSEFLTFFGIKSVEQFFPGIEGCDELRQCVGVLVFAIIHVTVKHSFQGLYCTFIKGSCCLTHLEWSCISSALHSFLNYSANSVPLLTQFFVGRFLFVVIVKNARTVTLDSFVFIPSTPTVLSNRSWRLSRYFTHNNSWLFYERMQSPYSNFHFWIWLMPSVSGI